MNHLDDTSTNTGGPLDGMGAFGERNCIELLGGENLQREEVHGFFMFLFFPRGKG